MTQATSFNSRFDPLGYVVKAKQPKYRTLGIGDFEFAPRQIEVET